MLTCTERKIQTWKQIWLQVLEEVGLVGGSPTYRQYVGSIGIAMRSVLNL